MAVLVFVACANGVAAQFRPLEPIDWAAVTGPQPIRISARVGWYDRQRAALAGVEGRLFELGEVAVSVRVGTVVLEFAGTPQWFLSNERVFAEPTGDARPISPERKRHDSGDYRVATIVPLTSRNRNEMAVLRFGTRLPTTDNRVGLDRDQTDFFALLGGVVQRGRARLGGEAGVSINGTRNPRIEQSDVLAYSASAAYDFGEIDLELQMVGQETPFSREVRGNENLGELRLGLRFGERRWFEATGVAGYRSYSPRLGLQLGGGMAINR